MEKVFGINQEVRDGQRRAERAYELYQLLSTYNAYNIKLLKAQAEYENKRVNFKPYYLYAECFGNRIDDLFANFDKNQYLKTTLTEGDDYKDMLFLIDPNTLLRLNTYEIVNSNVFDAHDLDYELIKINNCKAKVVNESIYCGDPYYCDYHHENKKIIGLFNNERQITPSYVLDNSLKQYDNADIREILEIQTLDDIYEKIKEAKEEKVKKLSLK